MRDDSEKEESARTCVSLREAEPILCVVMVEAVGRDGYSRCVERGRRDTVGGFIFFEGRRGARK